MTDSSFTALFLTFTVLSTAFALVLAWRHLRHVASHRGRVPDEFAEAISLSAHQKAADYTMDKVKLGMAEELWGVVVLLVLTFGGGLSVLYFLAGVIFEGKFGVGAHPYWLALIFVGLTAVATSLLSLPFELIRTFGVEAKHGFNNTRFSTWLADSVKGWVLAVVIGTPFLLGTFWLMDRMGSLWWLYVWLAWTGFSLLMIAVYPTFIAPLFNKFSPLEDASLKARIEALLARCGFAAKGLFVMDGSKRSAHGNAYFTGLGKSKQIVFFDTLMARLTPEEIEAVLAHELGHFKRRHIVKRLVTLFASSFVMLALMGWVIDKPWFYYGLNLAVDGKAPVEVSLVLFFTVLPVFTFWMTPLSSLTSRKHEFEADAYAAAQTNSHDLISALVKLYRDNAATLTPDPLHSAVYDSHPPAAIRIAHLKSLSPTT